MHQAALSAVFDIVQADDKELVALAAVAADDNNQRAAMQHTIAETQQEAHALPLAARTAVADAALARAEARETVAAARTTNGQPHTSAVARHSALAELQRLQLQAKAPALRKVVVAGAFAAVAAAVASDAAES